MDSSLPVFKTKIVPAAFDRFWADAGSSTADLAPKQVLVLAAEPVGEEMIARMLNRCGVAATDFMTFRVAPGSVVPWNSLNDKVRPRVVVLLGVAPADLGISALFVFGSPNRFGGAIWIPGPATADMEQTPDLRRQWWESGLAPVFEAGTFGKI